MIGGLGIVVEINESKFAKYKYHRGKRCGDSSWIFGGIQRTDTKRFFAIPIIKRNAETHRHLFTQNQLLCQINELLIIILINLSKNMSTKLLITVKILLILSQVLVQIELKVNGINSNRKYQKEDIVLKKLVKKF